MHSILSFYQKQLMKTVSWLSYQEEFSGWSFLPSGCGYGKKPAQVPTLSGSLTKEKKSLAHKSVSFTVAWTATETLSRALQQEKTKALKEHQGAILINLQKGCLKGEWFRQLQQFYDTEIRK